MSLCQLEEKDAERSYPRTCPTCGLMGRCHKRLDRKSLLEDQQKTVEKFVSPCPPPTPYERELLEILIEECAEVQQRATKMLRFGVMEIQPGQELTNAQRLAEEYGDLRTIGVYCEKAGLLPFDSVLDGMNRKDYQLAKYMQQSRTE